MTFIAIPTQPSVDIPNDDVVDGGRTLVGNPGPDRLPGTLASDNIRALSGDDLVFPRAGNDVVFLGDGSDTAFGGIGNDFLQGNQGDDSVSGGEGNDSLRGGKGNDTVDGGEGGDTLFGDRGDDIASGGAGDDSVQGNVGADIVIGDEGNDTLDGGKGTDSLNGGIGGDFLSGSRGNDILTGGTGADDFFFWYNANGSYGVDSLTDFNRDEGDRIVLAANFPVPEDARFNALTGTPSGAPVPADEFAVISNFNPDDTGPNGGGSTAAIIYDPASGFIYYNASPEEGDERIFAQVDNTVYDANNPLQNTDFEIF